jgi:hypothetical protein
MFDHCLPRIYCEPSGQAALSLLDCLLSPTTSVPSCTLPAPSRAHADKHKCSDNGDATNSGEPRMHSSCYSVPNDVSRMDRFASEPPLLNYSSLNDSGLIISGISTSGFGVRCRSGRTHSGTELMFVCGDVFEGNGGRWQIKTMSARVVVFGV